MKKWESKALNEIPWHTKLRLLVIEQVRKYEPLLKKTHLNVLEYPTFTIYYTYNKWRIRINYIDTYPFIYKNFIYKDFDTREDLLIFICWNWEKYKLGRRHV